MAASGERFFFIFCAYFLREFKRRLFLLVGSVSSHIATRRELA